MQAYHPDVQNALCPRGFFWGGPWALTDGLLEFTATQQEGLLSFPALPSPEGHLLTGSYAAAGKGGYQRMRARFQ